MSSRMIDAQRTGGTDQGAWTRSRYASLVSALRAEGIAYAEEIAADIVAHWARETGWGRSEWRFNIGNIKDTAAWRGDGQTLPDGLHYRAYADLDSGVRDTLALLRATRYQGAWRYELQTHDGLGWYDQLMRAGWHPWSQNALTEYASIRARVGRLVGLAAPPAAPPPVSSGGGAAALFAAFVGSLYAAWRYL